MLYKEFEAKIKRLNPQLVITRSGKAVWGMHLRKPRHPDANDNGLLHLFSVPSPWWYGPSMPETNRKDRAGNFVRGWREVLRLLVDKHLVSDSKARAAFGYRWRWDS